MVLPEVPTLGEFVPDYEVGIRNGFGAPKGTPAEIIAKLNGEITAALSGSRRTSPISVTRHLQARPSTSASS